MTLLHPARIGSPVSVWFNGDRPDRIVHGAERFRVVSPAEPLRRGWRFRAVADDGGVHRFEISGEGAHWVLSRIDPESQDW